MAENSYANVIDSLLKNVDHVVGSKTVVGEPMTVGDAIIIPLVDVSFGVAAGANINDKKNGGMGGMHTKMSPSAVLVIQHGHAKIVTVQSQDTLSKLVDMIPEVIDKFKELKDGVMKNDEAIDNAFPDRNKGVEDKNEE